MGDASVVTGERSWFADADRRSRTMRVSPHPQEGVVTLSVWEGRQCTNTVRITSDGKLFLDHLRGIQRDVIVRKIRKMQRAGTW